MLQPSTKVLYQGPKQDTQCFTNQLIPKVGSHTACDFGILKPLIILCQKSVPYRIRSEYQCKEIVIDITISHPYLKNIASDSQGNCEFLFDSKSLDIVNDCLHVG